MNDQTSPGKNQKSGRVSKKLGHFAKTDVRFWQDRLFRETYRKNGALRETSHWSARIQHAGRRERFPPIEGYATAFRKIVADLFGFASDPSKFDYPSGGRAEWLTKVHAVELSEVTPAKIQEWKQSFLTVAGNDPLALRKARISVNTFLRC
jgi:hypothetical protein